MRRTDSEFHAQPLALRGATGPMYDHARGLITSSLFVDIVSRALRRRRSEHMQIHSVFNQPSILEDLLPHLQNQARIQLQLGTKSGLGPSGVDVWVHRLTYGFRVRFGFQVES